MRMRFFGCCLAVLAVLATVSNGSAQQAATGSITGRVTDKQTQTPVAGATVEAITAAGRRVASASSSADGEYRLTNVPSGTYSIVITMVGFETERIEGIRVLAGEASLAGASLTSQAFLLNPLVVTASKKSEKALDAPAHVEVVAERDIAERPTTTPVEHLRSTPGIDVITTGVQGTNVVARGFNNIFSGALHTLTDYRAARVPSLHVNFMHFIPQTSDDMSRMEVVLGPGAALYGPNTANGVLHILTKSPLDEGGNAFTIAGGERSLLHATGRISQKVSETFGFKVSGQYMQANEWEFTDTTELAVHNLATNNFAQFAAQTPFNPRTRQPFTTTELQRLASIVGVRDFDTKRWSGDVRADWRATEALTLVASGGLTNATGIELTGLGAGQVDGWKYSYAQLRATLGQFFAQTYLNMSDAGETYLLRNGLPIIDKSKVWATQLQHSTSFGERQQFTYGADYIKTMPVTEGTINGRREDDDEYNEVGAYLQSTTRVHRLLDVVLAGRYDKHSRLDDPVWSPRAGVIFKPSEEHNFRVTYNRAFSTPTSLNLFLDIDGGALGGGFRGHALAPGQEGISFRNASGALGVSSPFRGTPATFEPITAANIYQLQVRGLAAASPAVGQNTALVGFLNSLSADPLLQAISLQAWERLSNTRSTFVASEFDDIPGIEESTIDTWEIGYKGLIGGKLLLAADAWWAKHKNFTSPLIAATPFILLDPAQLKAYLDPRVLAAVGGNAALRDQVVGGLIQVPAGVVAAPAAQGPTSDVLLTYVNFGEMNINGVDLSATALLSSKWQLGVSGSLVSDDHFEIPLRGDTQFVALNAPKKKASAHLNYRDLASGLNGELRVRYTDEFPANSAGYVGLACATNDPATGECVKSYTLLDVTAGYRLPFRGASLQLSVQNILDEAYQSFVGNPAIGRMAILRLRYDL